MSVKEIFKRIIIVLVLGLILSLGYNLTRQISSSLQANNRLEEAAEELIELQKRNSELKKRLADTDRLDFIEQEIRNKLNMARPNETVIIISKTEIEKVLGTEKVVESSKIPNWLGWIRLFY